MYGLTISYRCNARVLLFCTSYQMEYVLQIAWGRCKLVDDEMDRLLRHPVIHPALLIVTFHLLIILLPLQIHGEKPSLKSLTNCALHMKWTVDPIIKSCHAVHKIICRETTTRFLFNNWETMSDGATDPEQTLPIFIAFYAISQRKSYSTLPHSQSEFHRKFVQEWNENYDHNSLPCTLRSSIASTEGVYLVHRVHSYSTKSRLIFAPQLRGALAVFEPCNCVSTANTRKATWAKNVGAVLRYSRHAETGQCFHARSRCPEQRLHPQISGVRPLASKGLRQWVEKESLVLPRSSLEPDPGIHLLLPRNFFA